MGLGKEAEQKNANRIKLKIIDRKNTVKKSDMNFFGLAPYSNYTYLDIFHGLPNKSAFAKLSAKIYKPIEMGYKG